MRYLSKTEATTDQGNRKLRDSGVSFRFQAVPSAEGAIFLEGSGGMLSRKILKI